MIKYSRLEFACQAIFKDNKKELNLSALWDRPGDVTIPGTQSAPRRKPGT